MAIYRVLKTQHQFLNSNMHGVSEYDIDKQIARKRLNIITSEGRTSAPAIRYSSTYLNISHNTLYRVGVCSVYIDYQVMRTHDRIMVSLNLMLKFQHIRWLIAIESQQSPLTSLLSIVYIYLRCFIILSSLPCLHHILYNRSSAILYLYTLLGQNVRILLIILLKIYTEKNK